MNSRLGLTGRVKAAVINNGKTIHETAWTRNLWLDQGLDKFADTPLCNLFLVAVKGTGTGDTKEDLSGATDTYSIASGSATLTHTAGTRDFSVDDVGKLMRFTTSPFQEFTITAFNSVSSVDVSPNAPATITNKKIILHHVQQVGLTDEIGRTNDYSAVSGENKTETEDNVRTFTRTFIFPTENTIVEVVSDDNIYSQTGDTVTQESGTRNFDVSDVGSTITFRQSGSIVTITAFVDGANVTVTPSVTNYSQAITLTHDTPDKVEVGGAGDHYIRTGSTVTRTGTARDFTVDDVGKIIHFVDDDVETQITAFINAASVTVDVSGTITSQNYILYGYTKYQEVGFSHTEEFGDNLNIRVLLNDPVLVRVATSLRASDQLKLTYECKLTVTPDAPASQNLSSVISDPGGLMSGNKNGSSVIESFATSIVLANGGTDIGFPDLEPFYPGSAALSTMSTALDPLSNKIRDTNTVAVPMTAATYVDGSFARQYNGVFGLNDAIRTDWRSLMIYDPASKNAIFTFLFNASQKKDGEHTFSIVFQKSWNRDLS